MFRRKRGQLSLEFLFVVALILLIFFFIIFFSFQKRTELALTDNVLEKRSECFKFSNLISSAYTSGPGTRINTRTNFLVDVQNNSIISVSDLINTSVKLGPVVCNYHADIANIGEFTGRVRIENVDEQVNITQL